MQEMRKIILASASRERREILKNAGLAFTVEKSGYRENLNLKLSPRELAKYLALQKARAVAARLRAARGQARHKDALVIGADTIVVVGGKVVGKPRSRAHARQILTTLSGRTHSIITGFCVVDAHSGISCCRAVESRVTFRKLSPKEIAEYMATGEPMRASGAYSIRKGARGFVRGVRGDYLNVAGLPLASLRQTLKEFGIR